MATICYVPRTFSHGSKSLIEQANAALLFRCDRFARFICMSEPGELPDPVAAAEKIIQEAEARKPVPKPDAFQPQIPENMKCAAEPVTDEETIETATGGNLAEEPAAEDTACATAQQ